MDQVNMYFEVALQAIGVASILANLTPNDSDNKIIKSLNDILNAVAANLNIKGLFNK